MSATIIGARPSLGSSTSTNCGRPTMTRAIASICCSPPDRVVPSLLSSFAAGAESDHRPAQEPRGSRRAGAASPAAGRAADSPATVRPGKMRRSSGTKPTPVWQMASGSRPSSRSSSRRISPELGFTQPTIVLSSVVLPTPLRPKMPTTSPGRATRSMPWMTWLKP